MRPGSSVVRALGAALLLLPALLAQKPGDPLPPWQPGELDIHQIQTGRGNSAFLIFPDGTTMLIDAGAVPDRPAPELGPERPNASRSPAEWIARYIEKFSPRHPATLDYALITHYHDDHMAALAAVGRRVPIRTLIDRGDVPAPMPGALIDGYREFRRTFGGTAETVQLGRADQIVATRGGSPYPGFEVRNLAADGVVWTGRDTDTRAAFATGWAGLPKEDQPGENDFSLALRIRYGAFDYYTGGDLVGVPLDEAPAWQDLETPIARAIGAVDVAVLDHHGWLDTTNSFFLKTLQPRVVIIPAWHATHPDHGVLRRLLAPRSWPGPRDLFITTLLPAPAAIFSYLGQPFKSTEGHVVVRVAKSGASYQIFVLDDTVDSSLIKAVFGPYASR